MNNIKLTSKLVKEKRYMGYYSTGKGGWFFRNIYDEAYSLETIRKKPCTTEELLSMGLSAKEIEKYFLLIKQLYNI